MDKGSEILTSPILNIDFLYYLIYLFFKQLTDFFLNPFSMETASNVNFVNVFKYASNGSAVIDPEKYSTFGNGIASFYDGYSLFTPPHGSSSFGSFSGWLENFFNNPYCSGCPSFFDLFFGGMNFFIWLLVFLTIIILFLIRAKEQKIEEIESVIYDTVYEKDSIGSANKKSQRWENILSLTKSKNSNDWKMAIIDSDSLLEEILEENGYYGDGVGNKLKKANFSTINNAWIAHRIRNDIAHNPSYELTERDTKRAISNFSQVFSEFYHL